MIDLSGQVALVTGGSRGIGAATARLLASAGAAVAITYRSRKNEAEAVARDLPVLASSRLPVYQADLSSHDAADRVVDSVMRDFGQLDMVVVNHGIWPVEDTSVAVMSDDRWRETLRVNLDGVFFTCRAALNVMTAGRIVIVTSTAGQRGEAYHADYAATKGALIAFVKSLAVEAAPAVTVNSVAPGWVDTEMSATPYAADAGKGRDRIASAIPLQRIATAEDIAGPIVFLCSPLARHLTGEVINVNGGAVLCG